MANPVMSRTFIDKDVENHLLQACEQGYVSVVSKMMRLRVNPNVYDGHGVSALTKASAGK